MAKKIEMLNDQQEVVHPLTSSDCVIMENGKTLEEVMGDGVATPTVTHEGASFQVGVGDSNIEVVDGDVAGMTLEGQTYQNILPKPTTLIMETDEKEFKINDKIDNNIVLDDNVAEIATIKGQTYVNAVQEESASEYVAIGEELNGQSITTTGKLEGYVKNATLEGLTLVNTIQEPSGADVTVLDLDADINAQRATTDNTVQGGIHGATLKGQTLVNLIDTENGYGMRFQYDGTVDGDCYTVTTMSHGQKVVVNQAPSSWRYFGQEIKLQMLKPSTKYFVSGEFQGISAFQFMQTNGLKPISIDADVINNRYAIIETAGDLYGNITSQCLYGHISSNIDSGSVLMCNDVILVEYQEGMENWDIPYFRGMQSVEVPSVKTTGKNLLDKTENYNAETICGVQITTLGTNTFRLNGTVTKSGDISLCGTASGKHHVKIKPNTTYRAVLLNENDDVVEDLAVKVSNEDGSLVRWLGGVFATKNNETKAMWIRIAFADANIGKTYDNITVKAMLVETSKEVGEFEPYKSSTLTMKNILLISGGYTKGYINNNGDIFTTDKDFYTNDYTPIKPNIELTTNAANLYYYDENKNWIGRAKALGFTAPSNARYIKAQWDTTQGITINDLWVREKVTLRKVGDVQDELDLETGKLTQRVGEIVLDGSEYEWTMMNTMVEDGFVRFYTNPISGMKLNSNLICDKLPQSIKKYGEGDAFECVAGRNNNTRINVKLKLATLGLVDNTISSSSLDIFKSWLRNNNLMIEFELATPIIRKVDLSIVDQDNNSVKSIQTHPTLTHVSTSSRGLIPNIVIPSQLKYPTIIKPSTTYTVQLKQTTVNSEFPLTINLGGTTMAVPSTKFTIATPPELTSQDVIFTGKNNVIGEVVITEGDTTDIEYKFFEGMNDVKSPKLLARGKNLFDGQLEDGYLNSTDGSNLGWANYKRSVNFIKVNSKFKYRISKNATHTGGTFGVFQYDYNKKFITVHYISSTKESQTFTFDNRTEYIKVACTHNENEGLTIQFIQIEEGSVATSYEPYKGVTIEQSIDSIPLTSSMFEQGGYSLNSTSLIRGMSLQQIPLFNSDNRIKTKTLIKLKPNSTYTINTDMSFSYGCFNKDGNYIKAFDFCSTFTTDSETHYIVMNLRYADDSTITPSSLDSLNLTLQEVEDEIVLRSIGDVKDTLNLTTGEYVQRIGEIVLDGSEGWSYNPNWSNGDYLANYTRFFTNKANGSYNILSDIIPIGRFLTDGVPSSEFISGESGSNVIYVCLRKDRLLSVPSDNINDYRQAFLKYLQSNPTKVQYELATPIIHKVNLTNTAKLPSYASTTHYDTIVPSNSLVPNIKIPSTVDYNVAIKPSTQYTVRCNTTDTLSVNLGGSTGTLANGKVTLTTPSTLAHNSLKLGNGKAKEVMVIEGSEIKDNVPFFNGMKNVQMGGIKLVNIARGATTTALVTANANKTQFTYTGNGTGWGYILFDSSLLKPNTVYTLYMNVITNNGTDSSGSIKYEIGNTSGAYSHNIPSGYVGVHKKVITTTTDNFYQDVFKIAFRPTASGNQVVIQNPMVIEGDWTHLDEIPYIESEMIIEQPIIRSQGKNLFNIKETSVSWYGAIVTSNADNTITYTPNSDNSAALTTKFYFKQPIKVKTGIKYTYTMKRISGGNSDFSGTINNQILVRKKDGTTTNILGMSDFKASTFDKTLTATYTFDNTIESIIGISPIMYSINNLTSPIVMQFQIEEGSTATSYEPFKHQTLYSNRVIGYEQGIHYGYSNGTKYTNADYNSILADVEGLSIAYVTNGASNFTFWDKDNIFISGKLYLDTSLSSYYKNGFIAVPSNAKYMRFASEVANYVTDAYTKATVTGELPLRSLPNGVCDTLNLVTGEYVQRVGEVVLDGRESWINGVESQNTGKTIYFGTDSFDSLLLKNGSITSDKFNKGDTWSGDSECIDLLSTNAYNLRVRLSKTRLVVQDVNGFKEWLSQNPITVQYELATPIVRKIGLTAKGNYKEITLDGSENWGNYTRATGLINTVGYLTSISDSLNLGETEIYNVFAEEPFSNIASLYSTDAEGCNFKLGNLRVSVKKSRLDEVSSTGFKRYVSLNPFKIGYISTAQSATSYSNILKPIFFNDVKVQFMNNNVGIQPTLTLQPTSKNSYVMDMMKANTTYTLKALRNPNSFTIDGTSYNATTNGTFTSPSTLTNKLLITGQDVQELMIVEGDVTGKKLPYDKGIRSSFDSVDKVEVLSQNKNLFDINGKVNELIESITSIPGGKNIVKDGVIYCYDNFANNFGSGQIIQCKPNTKYHISCDKTGKAKIAIHIQNKSNSFVASSSQNKIDFNWTTPNDCDRFLLAFAHHGDNTQVHTISNLQVEEGTVATSYQPHEENTTIINMPTQLETVEVVKINMVKDMEIGAINHDTGANMDSSTVVRTKNYIPVQPSMHIIYCNNGVERATHFMYYDINKNFIGVRVYESGVTSKGTVTTPDNCYFIRLYHGVTNVDNLTITKKQHKPIALNSLPNGVKDELIINRATSSAKLIRRVGKVVLDGSQAFSLHSSTKPEHECNIYWMPMANVPYAKASSNAITDTLPYNDIGDKPCFNFLTSGFCYLRLWKDVELYSWLKQNPTTVYYELKEPIITEISLKGYPYAYKDGSVQLNTEIPHATKVKYNVNQEHLINGQNETIIRHDKQIDNLYDYIELYLEEEYRMELFRMQLELSL